MNADDAIPVFEPLYKHLVNLAEIEPSKRPRLAHYSSLDTMEKIITGREVWMSCPLFMNDHQEMRWSITCRIAIKRSF